MLTVLSTVRAWAVASQNRACRNATLALGALVERRAEREEVEQYLASHSFEIPAPRDPADANRSSSPA